MPCSVEIKKSLDVPIREADRKWESAMPGILDSVDQRTRLAGHNRLELLLFRLSGAQRFGINVFKVPRSEERRVGKECRSRWSPYH